MNVRTTSLQSATQNHNHARVQPLRHPISTKTEVSIVVDRVLSPNRTDRIGEVEHGWLHDGKYFGQWHFPCSLVSGNSNGGQLGEGGRLEHDGSVGCSLPQRSRRAELTIIPHPLHRPSQW